MTRFRLLFILLFVFAGFTWGGVILASDEPDPICPDCEPSRPCPTCDPTWATWQLDTAFVNGKVQAIWKVIVGGEDANGQEIELATASRPIPCWVDGAVSVGNGSADFQGGQIQCTLPDFAQAANALIAQEWGPGYALPLADVCECRPTQLRRVQAVALPTGTGSNPIFYHPNLSLAAPGEGGFFANALYAAGQSATSSHQKVKALTSLATDHLCAAADGCKFVHYRAGQVIGVDYQNFINAAMYTGKTTVYLGANPATGERFYGQMGSVHVDPGCRMD